MDDIEALATRWFDTIHSKEVDAIAALYADDAEYVRSDGTSKGPEANAAYLMRVLDAFPDHASVIDAILVGDSGATVEWTETGTHTEPYKTEAFGTIPPTGQGFKERIVEVFRFADGKIISQHEYYDLLSLTRQVGWLPMLAAATMPS